MTRTLAATGFAVLLAASLHAEGLRKRALLIGINDYSASRLHISESAAIPARSWSNLDGAVNDVRLMGDLLVALQGFDRRDIVTLTDQQATRAAIMQAIDRHLLAPAKKDDILFFYYSGHGSQVRNTRSTEDDRLDESLVPADSRIGAPDIRDKELRTAFNRILDRGARLTVVLDACHSGSGARGLDGGLKQRSVSPDLRDVADPSTGPEPEDRGALVLTAAQDFDLAFETLDANHEVRGAFSWALARAMRDAEPGEPASETFLRAQARLRFERPAQTPVLAGRDEIRLAPFLGTGGDCGRSRPVIAIENVSADGTYALLGGWANGITVGSRLRVIGREGIELEVTSLVGAGRAEARLASKATRSVEALHSGSLLELDRWAAPPTRKLRVWIPRAPQSVLAAIRETRRTLAQRDVRWIDDPTESSPTHLLRWRNDAWERIANGKVVATRSPLGDPLPAHAALFVQLPAAGALLENVGDVEGIELVDGPQAADYILAGRLIGDRIEYAWVRPLVTTSDRDRTSMPIRSQWVAADRPSTELALRDALLRLRRVHGWHELPSPPGSQSHYQLAVKDVVDRRWAAGPLIGGRDYQLVLRLRTPLPARPLYPRYVYAFVIDSHGQGVLLFPRPRHGSVENRLPSTGIASQPVSEPPAEIPLGDPVSFTVTEPYGLDAYFLLCTDEPLSSTSSLEWEGLRSAPTGTRSALEELLAQSLFGTRASGPIQTPLNWSIEMTVFESIPPRRTLQ